MYKLYEVTHEGQTKFFATMRVAKVGSIFKPENCTVVRRIRELADWGKTPKVGVPMQLLRQRATLSTYYKRGIFDLDVEGYVAILTVKPTFVSGERLVDFDTLPFTPPNEREDAR